MEMEIRKSSTRELVDLSRRGLGDEILVCFHLVIKSLIYLNRATEFNEYSF
jgi:hypothetical protein